MWEHEINDWRWALAVNVWGVIHGINAFVPTILAQAMRVTSQHLLGQLRHLATAHDPAVRRNQGGRRHPHRMSLRQLQATTDKVSASVLFPGPHMLRTGLFESWRSRPDEFASNGRARRLHHLRRDGTADEGRRGGGRLHTGGRGCRACHPGVVRRHVLDPSRQRRSDDQLRARTESILKRENPDYLRAVPAEKDPSWLPSTIRTSSSRPTVTRLPTEQYREYLEKKYGRRSTTS